MKTFYDKLAGKQLVWVFTLTVYVVTQSPRFEIFVIWCTAHHIDTFSDKIGRSNVQGCIGFKNWLLGMFFVFLPNYSIQKTSASSATHSITYMVDCEFSVKYKSRRKHYPSPHPHSTIKTPPVPAYLLSKIK